MSRIFGVRRAGDAHIVFVQSLVDLRVGDRVTVDAVGGSFTATVVIAADQVPDFLSAAPVSGTASRSAVGHDQHDGHSREDDEYRVRKQRFPSLGVRRPEGIVVRIDMRHEAFDVRDDRGDITTIALHTIIDSQS